jgi:hypothetical protein
MAKNENRNHSVHFTLQSLINIHVSHEQRDDTTISIKHHEIFLEHWKHSNLEINEVEDAQKSLTAR